ncbi:methyltransferase domain-containing protein [Piscinibacter sp. Jin2]|uniref:Methyltransferase domain-containing protein n=1 Tax=Aquariibacter lacus TaxID=2801332 RepID=A0A9X0XCF9_9BURK|nr:methyltransferase [Piscinibacter lacus]MBL0719290.1 methyltransferase domain-containing protein [Piscinibacter lacus]
MQLASPPAPPAGPDSAADRPDLALGQPQGWRERLAAWRDRRMADPAFRTWVLRTPLLRRVAQRRARQTFDLVAGFVYSQVLRACMELELFERLAGGPVQPAALARAVGLDEAALDRLLAAGVALKLLRWRAGGRIALGPLGAPLVGHTAIAALVEHHHALYADLADPVGLLRGPAGRPATSRQWPYTVHARPDSLAAEQVATYSGIMSASQPLIAQLVLDAYPVQRHRLMMDVGGGEGAFLRAVARQAPGLRLRLFDLPAVADRARQRFAEHGLAGRAEAVGGSFLSDSLPGGADLISLVRVVHDHDDATVRHLLRAAHAALPPGGTLLIAEPMSETPGAEAMGDAYFGLYLLAMGQGRPRSPATLRALLAEAGFVQIRQLATHLPLQTGLMVARVPGHEAAA